MKTRVVSAVKNVGGCCRPAGYAPIGMVEKRYEEMCSAAGLPICIGSTFKEAKRQAKRRQLEGLKMAKGMQVHEPMLPLEDIDFLEAPLFDPDTIKSMLTQTGVGAAGNLALSFGLSKVKINGHIKSGASLVATLAGARALWGKQRDVAQGLLGTSSFVLADWISHVLLDGEPLEICTEKKDYKFKFSIKAEKSSTQIAPTTEAPAPLKGLEDEDEDDLFGLNSAEDELLLGDGLSQDDEGESVFEAADVSEQRGLLSAADVIEQHGLTSADAAEVRSGFRGLVSVL